MFRFKKIISRFFNKDGIFFVEMKKLLGFEPFHIEYYEEAFTYPTPHNSEYYTGKNYQRLEFLGDASLGAVVSNYIFLQSPQGDEGYLTKMRSKMVRRNNLNQIGRQMNLLHFLKIENDKNLHGENIYGNLLEALIGAIYLDRGYKITEKFIYKKIIQNQNIKELEDQIVSYKSWLIEWAQKRHFQLHFEVEEDQQRTQGVKHFVAKIFINDKNYGKAVDTSKKKAEEKAARRVFYRMQRKKKN